MPGSNSLKCPLYFQIPSHIFPGTLPHGGCYGWHRRQLRAIKDLHSRAWQPGWAACWLYCPAFLLHERQSLHTHSNITWGGREGWGGEDKESRRRDSETFFLSREHRNHAKQTTVILPPTPCTTQTLLSTINKITHNSLTEKQSKKVKNKNNTKITENKWREDEEKWTKCVQRNFYTVSKSFVLQGFFSSFPLTCSTDFLVSVSLCTCCEPPSGRWQGVMKDSRSCECSSVKLVLGEKERTPASSSDSFVGVKCLFLLYLCFSFAREL